MVSLLLIILAPTTFVLTSQVLMVIYSKTKGSFSWSSSSRLPFSYLMLHAHTTRNQRHRRAHTRTCDHICVHVHKSTHTYKLTANSLHHRSFQPHLICVCTRTHRSSCLRKYTSAASTVLSHSLRIQCQSTMAPTNLIPQDV